MAFKKNGIFEKKKNSKISLSSSDMRMPADKIICQNADNVQNLGLMSVCTNLPIQCIKCPNLLNYFLLMPSTYFVSL